jgi:hypothetical protein
MSTIVTSVKGLELLLKWSNLDLVCTPSHSSIAVAAKAKGRSLTSPRSVRLAMANRSNR